MFGSLGVPEILFILVLALLVFGPRRLPELGRTIGRAMGEFRRATTDLRRTLNNELALEDESPRRPVPPRSTAAAGAGARPAPRPAAGTAPRGAKAAEVGAEAASQPAEVEPPGGDGADGSGAGEASTKGPPIPAPTEESR